MENKNKRPAELLCSVMKRIYYRDLTTLTGGNLSVTDEDGILWVTPTGIDKGALKPEDIVRVYPDGHTEGKHRPTSEYRIHHRIVLEHPEICAVLHAHPPALVTMSVLHELPDTKLTISAWEAVGEVGLSEYAFPGTIALVDCVAKTFAEGYRAAVLKNHATFLGSKTGLLDAYRRFEQLNRTAELQLNAATIGTLSSLTSREVADYRRNVKCYNEQDFGVTDETDKMILRELAALSHRAEKKKLFSAMSGAISARLSDGRFAIISKDADRATATEDDFVRIEGDYCESGKKPDPSAALHQAIYSAHPEVQSVIVADPVSATAFAVCDCPFDVNIIPESYGVLRNASRFSFRAYLEEKQRIAEQLDLEHPFAIIENLGIVLVGPNPLLTFDKLEVADFTAQSIQQALRSKKEIKSMTPEQQREADELSS